MARPKKQQKNSQSAESGGVAVIYARYSSHNQREASIEQQIDECQKFAARNNLKVIDIYADKAITGKTDQRPHFQRMMKMAEKKAFEYVIAWKSNRMGRNMLQAMINEARLEEYGVRCLYTEEDFDDTAAGRFALRNMMNVNQFYSENMAEDVMRGMMDNAKKCMTNGSLPYGYRRGSDGRYEIEPKEAEVVREIFERICAGDAMTAISKDLNGRGIKTSKGGQWNKNSFYRMLGNERYIGVYLYAGLRIEDGIPPILKKELFYAVQGRLKAKKNPRGRHRENSVYLLTGKLFCGNCGGCMVGVSGTSKTSAKHHYYDCKTKREEKTCSRKAVRRDWIEQRVAELVKINIMRDEVIDWLVEGYDHFLQMQREDSLLRASEEELDGIQRAIKNMVSAIEQGIVTSSTKERLVELEEEQRRLEVTIAVERAALVDVPREHVEFWLESFRDGDVTDKRYQAKLISSFVRAVYIYDNELRIACNYAGKADNVVISLDDMDGVDDDVMAESSYKLSAGSPTQSQTNPPTIYLKERYSFWFFLLEKNRAGRKQRTG